jgi:Domain of unknown function (DUF4388)
MSMADLIQWGRTSQRTGLFKFTDERGKEIRVVLSDGRIVFSSTNEKRERWRNYLLYHGFCSEEDIEAAFRVQAATGAAAAAVLVQENKITQDQALSTLTEKTIEDVCDVFLWPEGAFEFEPTKAALKSSMTINVDPIHVVWEGLRRAEIWSRMNAYIHQTSFFESSDEGFDEKAKWEDALVARHVFTKIDANINVAELTERLPFSRFKIYRGISELLSHRLIHPTDITAVVDRERRLARKIDDARAAAAAGRWTEAMEILKGLIGANPGRPNIVQELVEVTRGFERSVYEHNFTKEDVPVVTIGEEAMSRLNIEPAEGFLLSRIDGRLTIRDILRITPMQELEALRAFKRLLAARVIDFPRRKVAAETTASPAPTR